MRISLITIILFVLTSAAAGQSLLAKRAFDEGTRLANAGDFGGALRSYRRALTADGAEGEFGLKLRYNIGVCYYRVGQLKAARSELTAAIGLSNGQHQRAFYALGMTESALENWPAARAAFLASIDLAPQDGEAWFDLAFVYLAERDYNKAAAAFRKSIDNRSVDSAAGHNNLGVIMAIGFRYEAAEAAFEAALDLTNGQLAAARENLKLARALRNARGQLVAARGMNFAGRGSGQMGASD